MGSPRTIPMLPCADIDEIAAFYAPLGFRVTYRQVRPNPYVALAGHGFELHYYGMPGHLPEASHSTCGVLMEDVGAIWPELAEGLRSTYGRLPVAGFPRITRPRPRKNVDGLTGFSLVDPAGNWIRFFNDRTSGAAPAPAGSLGAAVENAVVLADSHGDVAQAHKILRGALARAAQDDAARGEAEAFLAELEERLAGERA